MKASLAFTDLSPSPTIILLIYIIQILPVLEKHLMMELRVEQVHILDIYEV